MKKQFYYLFLCVVCAASFSVSAYALEVDTNSVMAKASEEVLISPRVHDMEYKKVKTASKTQIKDLGAAGGQSSKGVRFSTGA